MSKYAELSSLVGEHFLTGVDGENTQEDQAQQSFRFCIDGIVYAAYEDPEDGYRSSMGKFLMETVPIRNSFKPVKVVGNVDGEILTLTDAVTGETVIKVGTDYYDSYYPAFVAYFNPGGMIINR